MGGLRKNRSRSAVLPTNLLSLQNLLKRDPASYKEEFTQQWNHYQATKEIFKTTPAKKSDTFAELISFIAQVAVCFPVETASFSDDLAHLLAKHHKVLDPDLREKLVQNLVLLRNKGVITSVQLLKTFFPILSTTNSKSLRAQLYESIVSTIRNENVKSKNEKLNKVIQSILFEMVASPNEAAGVWAIRLTKELWTKNIWAGDVRVAEICKTAALSSHTKVMLGGSYFFLGVDAEDMEEESEDEGPNIREIQHRAGVNKKSKSREKQVKKAISAHKKAMKGKKIPTVLNFSALQLLHDPQSFAEQLYSLHLASKKPMTIEHKLLILTLLSRLIGAHKLTLLQYYSFILKWISPHQRDVTQFLACLAGAAHEFVPPEILAPAIQKVANEFVTTGVSPEVVCAGLNSIREICSRAPLAMNAELLQDLTEYKGSKDKGVYMAARSLIGLYREAAPELLKKKDRGRSAAMGMKDRSLMKFGEERGVVHGIAGLDLLEAEYATKAANGEESEEDAGWDDWEADSEEESDEEGWIQVESDGEDLNISDSEDEDSKEKKALKSILKKKAEKNATDPDLNDEEQVKEETDAEAQLKAEEENMANLATTRILTPADFKKLEELRLAAGIQAKLNPKGKRAAPDSEFVDSTTIEGPRKKAKEDREARIASVKEGREGRAKFGSRKGERGEEGRSTTNREKARKKNFLMVQHKKEIQGKSMVKLTIKRQQLKAHIARGKRGGKRGNK